MNDGTKRRMILHPESEILNPDLPQTRGTGRTGNHNRYQKLFSTSLVEDGAEMFVAGEAKFLECIKLTHEGTTTKPGAKRSLVPRSA